MTLSALVRSACAVVLPDPISAVFVSFLAGSLEWPCQDDRADVLHQ